MTFLAWCYHFTATANQEKRGGGWIHLFFGDDPCIGGFRPEPFDYILGHLEFVVEELLPVYGGQVQNRFGGGQAVVDGILQSPPSALPWVGVEGAHGQVPVLLREIADGIEMRGGIAVEGRLGQNGDDVVRIHNLGDISGIPRVEDQS